MHTYRREKGMIINKIGEIYHARVSYKDRIYIGYSPVRSEAIQFVCELITMGVIARCQ